MQPGRTWKSGATKQASLGADGASLRWKESCAFGGLLKGFNRSSKADVNSFLRGFLKNLIKINF